MNLRSRFIYLMSLFSRFDSIFRESISDQLLTGSDQGFWFLGYPRRWFSSPCWSLAATTGESEALQSQHRWKCLHCDGDDIGSGGNFNLPWLYRKIHPFLFGMYFLTLRELLNGPVTVPQLAITDNFLLLFSDLDRGGSGNLILLIMWWKHCKLCYWELVGLSPFPTLLKDWWPRRMMCPICSNKTILTM